MSATTKDVLTPADVAPLLGVTTGRVYQLISAGVIPALRIGGAVRIPRGAWETWLREQGKGAWAAAREAQRSSRARARGRQHD